MRVLPQYFWGVGGRSDQGSNIENASNMNLLYFGFLNLPDAWQVGMNPVITYDHKASRGNKWNVPIGLAVAKTTKIGRLPVKFQLAAEYSVVRQDDFGKQMLFKLNIIPVIPALIGSPMFGGNQGQAARPDSPPFSRRAASASTTDLRVSTPDSGLEAELDRA